MKPIILTPELIRSFRAKYIIGSQEQDCWVWIGNTDKDGYGIIGIRKLVYRAHRVSYVICNRSCDTTLDVLHSCDNPPCVNPAHLFQGTRADNNRDKESKGRGIYGEKSWAAKLTESEVLEIRRRSALGERQMDLAAEFTMARCSISQIVNREIWTHI